MIELNMEEYYRKGRKIFLKIFRFFIDKSPKVWYIIIVKRERTKQPLDRNGYRLADIERIGKK